MDNLIELAKQLAGEADTTLNFSIPKRIAYVVSHGQSYASNGYAIRTQGIAEALNKQGFDTLCLIRPGRPWELGKNIDHEVLIRGVRYIHCDWDVGNRPKSATKHLEISVQYFTEVFKLYRPEAVLAASDWVVGLPAWIAAKRLGLPFYNEVRGFWELSRDAREPGYIETLDASYQAKRDLFVAMQAEKIFTLNYLMKRELVRRGVNLDKIAVVPNGVSEPNKKQPANSALRSELGILDGDKVIGYLGSHNHYEGLDYLFDSCACLIERGEPVKLLLVGDEQPLNDFVKNDSLVGKKFSDRSWIIQVGRIPHDFISDYYALIDVVVIPRRKKRVCEIVPPIKVVEALSYDKRIVVSNIPPLIEYAEKHAQIKIFDIERPETLIKAIEESLASTKSWSNFDQFFSKQIYPIASTLNKKEHGGAVLASKKDEALGGDNSFAEKGRLFNENLSRESSIFKIFLESDSLLQKDLEDAVVLYAKVLGDIDRIKLVVHGEKADQLEKYPSFSFGNILFQKDVKKLKDMKFDISVNNSNSLIGDVKYSVELQDFSDLCEALAKLYLESIKNSILYFVSTTEKNTEAGYHRRTLHLKKAFQSLCVQFPIISCHSTSFRCKNNIIFIPKNKKIISRLLCWLSPKTVIAASNYENAMPLLDIRETIGFEFIYEMRGLWHETYAAKMLEIDKNYDIENDKNYKKGLNGELDVVRKSDKVLFICEEMRDYVISRIPEKEINCGLVGNGYDIESGSGVGKIVPIIPRRSRSQTFVIGYFGSITYYEGISLLLDSAKELIEDGLSVKVILVGKNSISHKSVLDLGKYDFVTHEDFKEDISPYYEKIDLFVAPRLPYEVCHSVEPLKPFDCFAKKVPLLLSDCKALFRLSDGGSRCLVFKAGNKESLKKEIKKVIVNGYPPEKLEAAWEWVSSSLNWLDIAKKYLRFIGGRRKKIYYLYGDKWRISYQWSGASINAINEMAVLAEENDVYYNDVFVNDLFRDGIFDENAFMERYSNEARKRKSEYSVFLPKIFRPSRNYDASFYRSGSNEKCVNFFLNEMPDPRIFSHNYVDKIWERGEIIGFQTESSKKIAIMNELASYDDDGTLGYSEIKKPPRKSFVRYQVSSQNASSSDKIFDQESRSRLKKDLDSNFLIGVIGTIYEGTYPDLLFSAVEEIRQKHPELKAKVVIYSINILQELPDKDWIFISSYSKKSQEDALLQLDVIVNTWKSSAQIYSGSNKNIDAINHAIPLIAAKTPSYSEQLGENYPLFYDFDPSNHLQSEITKQSLTELLIKCSKPCFREEVSRYLIWRRSFLGLEATSWLYEKQLSRLKKRILVFAQNFGVGGVQKYSVQLIKSVPECDITIVSKEVVPDEKVQMLRGISGNIKIEYFDSFKLDSLHDYDLAFINSFPVEGGKISHLTKCLKNAGVKVFPIVHSDIHPFTVEISRHLEFVDELVTINKDIIEKIKVNTGWDFKDRFRHITPVLDSTRSIRDVFPGKSQRSNKVAFFGRIAPLKCVDFLIGSFARYVSETSSIYQLIICGPVAQKGLDLIVKKANELAGKQIVFLEDKSFDSSEREKLFKTVDALIYTTATEGLPYTFLEANELGTPVISSAVGAIEELISDGVNGLLFKFEGLYLNNLYEEKPYNKLALAMRENEEKNYQEFKRVMCEFERDEQAFLQMSKNAISLVNDKFSFDVMRGEVRNLVYNGKT